MTEIQWYSLSQKLLEGITISNSIEHNKFSILLGCLFKAAQQKVDNPFSEEELKNLATSLKLNDESLKLTLSSLAYITKRSLYFIMKPTILQEELTEKLKFDLVKAEAFVKLWTEYTKTDFDDLQQRLQLEKFSWELNLEVASDTNLKKVVPTSLLQFQVKNKDGRNENIIMEMNENELLGLYNQMENIQAVLDSLNK